MHDCVFCQILEGSIPSSVVYRDDLCTAFLDIQPVNEGHVLIIPNKHVESMADLDDETTARMFIVAKRINIAIRNTNLRCEGLNYFLADGEAAFQEVFHAHLHCFPRYKDDGFGLVFGEHYHEPFNRSRNEEIANQIRQQIILL